MNVDTLKAEVATTLHNDWCGCDSWDGSNCDEFDDMEFVGSSEAVVRYLLLRKIVNV